MRLSAPGARDASDSRQCAGGAAPVEVRFKAATMALPADKLPRVSGPDRLSDPPAKLAAHEVDWHGLDAGHVQRLETLLTEATDERPLQTFLASVPYILVLGVLGQRRQAWVFDRPRFGAEYIPDFLIGRRDSLGPTWMLVELESPTADPLRKDGAIRTDLHHAVQQVQDYKRWLGQHGAYFREQHGCWGIEAGCAATIVIGRRGMRESEAGKARMRDLRRDGIEVMSYDRLVETCRNQTTWFLNLWQRVQNLVSSRSR